MDNNYILLRLIFFCHTSILDWQNLTLIYMLKKSKFKLSFDAIVIYFCKRSSSPSKHRIFPLNFLWKQPWAVKEKLCFLNWYWDIFGISSSKSYRKFRVGFELASSKWNGWNPPDGVGIHILHPGFSLLTILVHLLLLLCWLLPWKVVDRTICCKLNIGV